MAQQKEEYENKKIWTKSNSNIWRKKKNREYGKILKLDVRAELGSRNFCFVTKKKIIQLHAF